MTTASDIAASLTQSAIARALGVGQSAVANAVSRGSFPSRWFPTIKAMCDASGLQCPFDCFAFLPVDAERIAISEDMKVTNATLSEKGGAA